MLARARACRPERTPWGASLGTLWPKGCGWRRGRAELPRRARRALQGKPQAFQRQQRLQACALGCVDSCQEVGPKRRGLRHAAAATKGAAPGWRARGATPRHSLGVNLVSQVHRGTMRLLASRSNLTGVDDLVWDSYQGACTSRVRREAVGWASGQPVPQRCCSFENMLKAFWHSL